MHDLHYGAKLFNINNTLHPSEETHMSFNVSKKLGSYLNKFDN